MSTDAVKLGLINRLMKVKELSTLQKVEELLIQAEMEARAATSLDAIKEGDVVSLDEFGRKNKQWLQEKHTG